MFLALLLTLLLAVSAVAQKVKEIDQIQFKQLVGVVGGNNWTTTAQRPCVVDFNADWCGPCRKVAPIMEKLANEYEGKLTIYKVNVDQERELAGAFQISSIPVVLFIPMEGRPMMQVGAMQEQDYRKVVKDYLVK